MLIAVWAAGAHASDLEFTASVDRREVALNERLTFTLSISASDLDDIGELQMPETGSLELVGRQTHDSMSFTFSSGRQSYRKTRNVVLTLQPTRKGKVTIGAASLRFEGKTYKTDPVTVRVVDARKQPPGRTRRPRGWPTSPFLDPFDDWPRSPFDDMFEPRRVEIDADAIFVRAYTSPDVVVEGQQVTVTVTVYSRVGARIASIRWPKLDGFFSIDRDVSKEKTDRKYVKGVAYQYKVLDQKALFPLKAGEMTIGPVEVEVETSTSPFFPAKVRRLRTRPLSVQVVELPAQDRPEGFHTANVGSYTLSATVDTRQAVLNQPVTYTLTLRGVGNIQRVRLPELPDLPRFKRFDPTVDVQVSKSGRRVRGSKTYEYILVPLASGELVIPELSFSFYDPQTGGYRTLRTEPKTIEVAAGKSSAGAESGLDGHQVNIVARGFDSTIPYGSRLEGYGPPFYRHALFAPLLVVPPCLVLLLVVLGWIRARVQADSPRNRMRRAWARRRRHVKRAAQLAGAGQADAFYAEIKEAVMAGLEARAGFNPHGMTLTELRNKMVAAGFSSGLTDAIVRELENCDFGRFAPATSRAGEMQAALERVRGLLKSADRERVHPVEVQR